MIKIENANQFMFQNIDKLIEEGKLDKKKIILFGLNTSSYAAKEYLEKKGYSIYAYIDNDRKKREDANEVIDEVIPHHFNAVEYENVKKRLIRAYQPEELLSDYMNDVVVLIASKYYVSMCSQLAKMGYREHQHIFQTIDFFGLQKMLKDEVPKPGLRVLEDTEIRHIQLEIVKHLKDICEAHNLRYFMTGGTLLGAVRHKGYIPWDDDIDVTMPMPDYKKLLEILEQDEDYEVLSIYNHPDTYFNFFTRLICKRTEMKLWEYPFLMTSGINIDIFPLIAMPSEQKERQSFFSRIRRLNTSYSSSFISNSEETEEVVKKRAKIREEVIQMMEQYDFDTCDYMGYILSRYWEKDIMPRCIYDDKIEMQFEDITLAAPVGYAEYLERIFGDYMKLPPKEQQVRGHNYKAYIKIK